ncbi:MAG: 6,7-dimethyl-8-ribityllumazine synthase [Chloroflexi bacterium]|nr:6,7-dimethyl-8-ribityllumazine synthase [Chloroflexota bacterium]
MARQYEGSQSGKGLSIAIAVARFNSFITERLLGGALAALREQGVAEDKVSVAYVPGAFELPFIAKKLAQTGRYDAIVCLGCVIRGHTPHFDYVCDNTSRGVLLAGLDTGVPVIFGVLTTDTVEQARSRAGAEFNNRGRDYALGALEMANLSRAIQEP